MCVYLDYAVTHPRVQSIEDSCVAWWDQHFSNVGRWLYDRAVDTDAMYHTSKQVVAAWIGCEPREVIYTYSATYGLNLLAWACEKNIPLWPGDVIVLSISEHHANIVPWQMLAKRTGCTIRFARITDKMQIDMNHLRELIDARVKIVSLQYASNVTGAVHPLENVRNIIGRTPFFAIDATQIVWHTPLNMSGLGADALVFSGHKIGADTGIWVLALHHSYQKSWEPPLGGWRAISHVSQDSYDLAGIPDRWEPGTPHIMGAFSLIKALERIRMRSSTWEEQYKKVYLLFDKKFRELALHKKIQLFHADHEGALGIWSFIIEGIHSTDLAEMFADQDCCVRSGYHCCEPLHTSWQVAGTLRVSIGHDTTLDECEYFFGILENILASTINTKSN